MYIYKSYLIILIPKPKISIFANPFFAFFRRVAFRCAGNSHPILIHVAHLAWSSGRQWLTSGGCHFFCLGPLIEHEKTLGFNLWILMVNGKIQYNQPIVQNHEVDLGPHRTWYFFLRTHRWNSLKGSAVCDDPRALPAHYWLETRIKNEGTSCSLYLAFTQDVAKSNISAVSTWCKKDNRPLPWKDEHSSECRRGNTIWFRWFCYIYIDERNSCWFTS